MKIRISIYLALACMAFAYQSSARAEETHADRIISQIVDTRQSILDKAQDPSADKFLFLAFWDFDGTILKGDCSEGLNSEAKTIYKGLAQLTIETGLSKIYVGEDGFTRFSKDYHHFSEQAGHWLAYPYLVQMLRGSKVKDVSSLAADHFADVLHKYYFKSSIKMLNELELRGIQNHIISASADVFVDASATTMHLPVDRFNGIEGQIEKKLLTEKLVYPVTWADGKVEKLITIVEQATRKHPEKQVIVLAAFGNSYSTDGPFMKYVAGRILPAGSPFTVMINGGEAPQAYQSLFFQVQQSEVQFPTTTEAKDQHPNRVKKAEQDRMRR